MSAAVGTLQRLPKAVGSQFSVHNAKVAVAIDIVFQMNL